MTSVPVILDDMKSHVAFELSRCVFFTIECDDPSDGWSMSLRDAAFPFMMLGLAGVIVGPARAPRGRVSAPDTFVTVRSVDALFQAIESHGGLFVNTATIWLPTTLLERALPRGQPPHDGDVFRVEAKLFAAAYRYTAQSMSIQHLMSISDQLADEVQFSREETSVLLEWARSTIAATDTTF